MLPREYPLPGVAEVAFLLTLADLLNRHPNSYYSAIGCVFLGLAASLGTLPRVPEARLALFSHRWNIGANAAEPLGTLLSAKAAPDLLL